MSTEDKKTALISLIFPVLIVLAILRSRKEPLWAEAYRRLRKNWLALFSIVVLSCYGLIAVLDGIGWQVPGRIGSQTVVDKIFERQAEATYSSPFAARTSEVRPKPLLQPGSHPLGTDGVGSDVLYRSIKAVRTALSIGLLTIVISVPLALFFGLVSGYFGKRVDDAVQYTYTVLASVPEVLLLTAIILVLKPGVVAVCIALGTTSWVNMCRLVRGETLRHRDREYVRAAKALGANPFRIMLRHILPNLLPVVIISVTLALSNIVLFESILSYLGVGVGPDTPSWGNMINAARDELTRDPAVWWNIAGAALALLILVLALNFLADALRDAIDPRLRSS
jgi:peptide/nickel transport system permease protein